MCCSRVCSVSTKPRRPSTSVVSPAIRPGIRRRYSSRGGEEAERRARRSRAGCRASGPRRRATSTPNSPGGAQHAERDRVALDDDQRAGRLRGGARAPRGPRRRRGSSGCCEERRRATSSPIAAASASASVTPSRSGDLLDRRRRSRGASSRSVSRECGCRPRETTKRVRPLCEPRQVAGGGDGARALVDATRWRPAGRSARRSPSGTRTSPAARPGRPRAGRACTASGTPSAT